MRRLYEYVVTKKDDVKSVKYNQRVASLTFLKEKNTWSICVEGTSSV